MLDSQIQDIFKSPVAALRFFFDPGEENITAILELDCRFS
jgi:hypothetical protein